ncbi:hypothetical protein Taro_056913 [Colocasia esculenta]|uniref:Uncharacterized protein n=1 Tax=Colocasia esculenta TaxID=4460 RepID=A0A843XXJ5_COLES|nr:hypothetical protein [Colocasia esculenta]
MKCLKSFFSCASSVGSAPLPSTASFSPEIPLDFHVLPLERMACNFWRWSKIWKAPFGRQKGLGVHGHENLGCVDTLSRTDKLVFWELDLVSTPLEAVSTHSTDLSTGFSRNWD